MINPIKSILQLVGRFCLPTLALTMAFQQVAAQDACGVPVYQSGSSTAVYVWRDCPDNVWHVRVSSANGYKRFTGSVQSSAGFLSFSPFDFEGDDVLNNASDPLALDFRMGIVSPWEDGFEFILPIGASACFRLDASGGAQILVGRNKIPVANEFDIDTLGNCGVGVSLPIVTVEDISVLEGDGHADFSIRLNAPASDAVSVNYATAEGSAIVGDDFLEKSGSIVFQAGETVRLVSIDIIDDADIEGPENFKLLLSNPVNALLASAEAVALIQDDEQAPVCGEPTIDPAVDGGVFLWKDCAAGGWRSRYTAGGSTWTRYSGSITSDNGFASVTPVDAESLDSIDWVSDPTSIDYSVSMIPPYYDGLDFVTVLDEGTCFEVTAPSGQSVFVGPGKILVSGPFDLSDLGDCRPAPPPPPPPPPSENYNVVVLFTDDQRLETLEQLPNISSRLLPNGVSFSNAYVPTPLCCPARTSVYSGGYLSQNTGVLENKEPNGGNSAYVDTVNIGTKLQQANYQTMFIGKWQNDYPLKMPYVPPGWNNFTGRGVWASGAEWSSFKYLVGSSGQSSSTGSLVDATGQYNAYFERDRILEFLDGVPAGKPFLVFWAPSAPHPPAQPAAEDAAAFSDYTYRGRGYTETDYSDKPPWVQKFDPNSPGFKGDEAVRNQLRSLLAVDRSLASILNKIEAQGKLNNTVFIVTSDNGYMWGEHKLWGKNYSYEESIRVPMLVVAPGITARTENKLVSAVLDLGPTLYEIAGIPDQNTDGTSLLPLLEDPNVAWRNELYFEKYSTVAWANGLWDGLRRDNWKYVKYWTGDEELYDLDTDPYELDNLAKNPANAALKSSMAVRAEELRGLAIMPNYRIPNGQVGQNYYHDFQNWGGKPPFVWVVETGSLPPGVNLNPANGDLIGVPTRAGTWQFSLRITGSGIARQTQKPRTFVSATYNIVISN